MTQPFKCKNNIAVASKFDLFHAGHKQMLDDAYSLAIINNYDRMIIGIASDSFCNNDEYKSEPYTVRLNNVIQYIDRFPIGHPYIDITLFDSKLNNLDTTKDICHCLITDESEKYMTGVNLARKERNLEPLKITLVTLIYDKDGNKISTKNIRAGKIDRDGNSLQNKK